VFAAEKSLGPACIYLGFGCQCFTAVIIIRGVFDRLCDAGFGLRSLVLDGIIAVVTQQ
jgi:hypothetical protein